MKNQWVGPGREVSWHFERIYPQQQVEECLGLYKYLLIKYLLLFIYYRSAVMSKQYGNEDFISELISKVVFWWIDMWEPYFVLREAIIKQCNAMFTLISKITFRMPCTTNFAFTSSGTRWFRLSMSQPGMRFVACRIRYFFHCIRNCNNGNVKLFSS